MRFQPVYKRAAVKPGRVSTPPMSKKPSTNNPVPACSFWGRRVVTTIDPKHVFPYINENALFRGQWGYKPKA